MIYFMTKARKKYKESFVSETFMLHKKARNGDFSKKVTAKVTLY